MTRTLRIAFCLVLFAIVYSCATLEAQFDSSEVKSYPEGKTKVHSFYLLGDGGNSLIDSSSPAIIDFAKAAKDATENSTAIFLGDNIYPKGMPKKDNDLRVLAEHQLDVQIASVKDFKGKTLFIPGNHDWYSDGVEGLRRQEKYIEKRLGKKSFLPKSGCPLERVKINDKVEMIVVDSEWYITNWDKQPNINDDCEIKTRHKFFDEFESLIKKARGKTTILAMHHPMFANGPHGGQYSFKSHMQPIPILGSIKNILRRTTGVSRADLQNKRYNEFKMRLVTLAQENDKVIIVSGHEHSLQYIEEDNLKQIISGSGSKITPTRNVGGGVFSYAAPGYAILDVFDDGSSFVRFYSTQDQKVVFQTEVFKPEHKPIPTLKPIESDFVTASVYTKEETQRSKLFKSIWGKRYRSDFSIPIKAPTVNLDTLYGGLTPVRKGGGHQSNSLRLKTKDGREFVLRALRKDAAKYLQAVAFKNLYVEGQFDETYTEGLLMDVFTAAHPYAPFIIGDLSDPIGVYHSNPRLFYVPKQKAIGVFNDEYGDDLYMIEERAADGHGNLASFGYSNTLISTDDLLKEILEDESKVVDEASYVKARLFDMLIGDWDRHEDQWRWAEFKENDMTIYKPVPRDRDQAFSLMSDGWLVGFMTTIIPDLRLMKSYQEDLKSPKWFNLEPYPLDMALIKTVDKSVWDAQVRLITSALTDDLIDSVFQKFPPEVSTQNLEDIKRKLKGRRENLQKISDEYYEHVSKFAIVTGTQKDDWFDIERLPNGETRVTAYRIKKGKKKDKFHDRVYNNKETKEIWVYALDDTDVFEVYGEGDHLIKVRLIGGQNKDTFNITNGKRIVMYDYKSKQNEFVTNKGNKVLRDDYDINVYDYKKLKNSSNKIIPTLGSNPDDGFKFGLVNTFTAYGFERNPFTSQHQIKASMYFATNGFDLQYTGEFSHVMGKLNLRVHGIYTSPNYSINFFGYGNSTPNPNYDDDDTYTKDYNRVRLSTFNFAPTLVRKGDLGSEIRMGISYEAIEVEETEGRFINLVYQENGEETQEDYIGIHARYSFQNKDLVAFPSLGVNVDFLMGYKNNLNNSKGFGYLIPALGLDYKLNYSGSIVLASMLKSHINFGDDFEFYQAASIGARDGLRGYRNQRFTGKSSFYQSSDLRFELYNAKTGLLPISLGLYGGFDYGKVWVDDELLVEPHLDSGKLNTSYGGGLFINGADMLTGNFSVFYSDEGPRFAFILGFGF
ncbi:MAG: phosphoesterase [Bacteroidetes bacterium MedPE-SWsnd-G2]|nr:MAG: phosphoesterase [Bacteroidetes bacterium MedPE-SWsnd-G2]